ASRYRYAIAANDTVRNRNAGIDDPDAGTRGLLNDAMGQATARLADVEKKSLPAPGICRRELDGQVGGADGFQLSRNLKHIIAREKHRHSGLNCQPGNQYVAHDAIR